MNTGQMKIPDQRGKSGLLARPAADWHWAGPGRVGQPASAPQWSTGTATRNGRWTELLGTAPTSTSRADFNYTAGFTGLSNYKVDAHSFRVSTLDRLIIYRYTLDTAARLERAGSNH